MEHDSNHGSKASFGRGPWNTVVHFGCENKHKASILERYLHVNIEKTREIVESVFRYKEGSLKNVSVLEGNNEKGYCVDLDDFYFAPRTIQEFLNNRKPNINKKE